MRRFVTGHSRRVQIAQIVRNVVPALRIAPKHTAHRTAHRPAFDFAKNHQRPRQPAHVAHRVAEFHPAGRLVADPVGRDMLVRFRRVMPEELAVIASSRGVEREVQRLDLHHALERVKARAGRQQRRAIGFGPALPHQGRVARAGRIAGACQQAACGAGASFAVFGAGSVGLSAVMAARVVGATTIVAIDLHDERLDFARSVGATHTLNPSRDDVVASLVALTGYVSTMRSTRPVPRK